MIDIFIPCYERAENIKTLYYFIKIGWDKSKIHILIDNEQKQRQEYIEACGKYSVWYHVFNYKEAYKEYDFVYNVSEEARTAGMARNQISKIARKLNIDVYVVIDDDTRGYQLRAFNEYVKSIETGEEIRFVFDYIAEFMKAKKIGVFALCQTGDMFEKRISKLLRRKVMNTTFYLTKYYDGGERDLLDNDTSMFCEIHNQGLFTGSYASGLVLCQTASATQKGGMTELYKEQKLLKKALCVPIQHPSAVHSEKQVMNGGRLHHRINYRYIAPMIVRGERDNISWESYPEDEPFSLRRRV